MKNSSLSETYSQECTKEMNLSQEISNSSIDRFSTITCLKSPIIYTAAPQQISLKSQSSMKSKKQYSMKTCHFVENKIQQIPLKKMFLTCLDFLIVESSSEMNQLSTNKFLSSFNYFKRVVSIERNVQQDWIRVNLQYVTMKKIPIKIMQQRLCNSKDKTGSEISSLLQQGLFNYNKVSQSKKNGFKLIQPSKMVQNLKNKFCLYFEVEQQENLPEQIERLIYDFHVKSICFSSLLAKFIAGDSSNLINFISQKGVPEIYSSKTEYFDFWKKRLGFTLSSTIKSTLQTLDGYDFECEEKIRFFQHSENGQLIIQILFDFENGQSSQNQYPNQSNQNLCSHSYQNISKFMKSERKKMISILKSLKISFLSDPFVTSIFKNKNIPNIPFQSSHFQQLNHIQNTPQTPSLSKRHSIYADNQKIDDNLLSIFHCKNQNQINLGVSTCLI